MKLMNPHIAFGGNAREALALYQDLFGGESTIFPVGEREDTGLPSDAIFHSELKGENFSLMAADAASVPAPIISLHIVCEDKAELERTFAALSDGGQVQCAICAAFGGLFAMVTDRFGIGWYLTLLD